MKRFLYTAFYSGLSPVMPGTMGTLVAFALYLGAGFLFPAYIPWISAAIVVVTLYPSIRLGDCAEKETGVKDPQIVVLDEVLGYFAAVAFLPFSWQYALAALFLFRLFDILKPWPVSAAQRLGGGLGIFLDDILAGVMANLVLWGIHLSGILPA
jgi:phosphatidylglycerophosphatase A